MANDLVRFLKQPPRIMGVDVTKSGGLMTNTIRGNNRRRFYDDYEDYTSAGGGDDIGRVLNALLQANMETKNQLIQMEKNQLAVNKTLLKEIQALNQHFKKDKAEDRVKNRKEDVYRRENLRMSNSLLRHLRNKGKSSTSSFGKSDFKKAGDTLLQGLLDTLFPGLGRMGATFKNLAGLGMAGLLFGKNLIKGVGSTIINIVKGAGRMVFKAVKSVSTMIYNLIAKALAKFNLGGLGAGLGGAGGKTASKMAGAGAKAGAKGFTNVAKGAGMAMGAGALAIATKGKSLKWIAKGATKASTKLLTTSKKASKFASKEAQMTYDSLIKDGVSPEMAYKGALKRDAKVLSGREAGTIINPEVASAGAKGAKAGTKTGWFSSVAKNLGKAKPLGKGILKTTTKIGGKAIPVLGLATGLAFSADRISRGDWVGAGLEMASSLSSTAGGALMPFTGGTSLAAGLAGTLAIESYIAKRDKKREEQGLDRPGLFSKIGKWFDKKFKKEEKEELEDSEKPEKQTLADKLMSALGGLDVFTGTLLGGIFGAKGENKGVLQLLNFFNGGSNIGQVWDKGDMTDYEALGEKLSMPSGQIKETITPFDDKATQLLNSNKYKVGTKEYEKLKKQFREEYANSEANKYMFESDKKRNKFIKDNLNTEEANKYAVGKIVDEMKQLKSSVQHKASPLQMGVSAKGEWFTKNKEGTGGYRIYSDLGVPAGGYGHRLTGKDKQKYKLNDKITKEQAEIWWQSDKKKFEQEVRRVVKAPITQGQFDALFDLAYNQGSLNPNSGLIKAINRGDSATASKIFQQYNKYTDKNGKLRVHSVLDSRRKDAIAQLWNSGAPVSQKVQGTLDVGYDTTKELAKAGRDLALEKSKGTAVEGLVKGAVQVGNNFVDDVTDFKRRTTSAKDAYLENYKQMSNTANATEYTTMAERNEKLQTLGGDALPNGTYGTVPMNPEKYNSTVQLTLPTVDVNSLTFLQLITQM